MNLIQFINNRTEELMEEQDQKKSFSLKRQSEGEALRQSLKILCFFMKWLYVPAVFIAYGAMLLGITEKPTAPLADKMIYEQNKKLRKIGMAQKNEK